uniref:Uncharacterized protein n=1 Tax=Schistocephalus solidus TaxID=70667 RepID=A0A0X3NLF8_SCHSO
MEEALPSTDEDIMPAISTNPTVLSKSSHSDISSPKEWTKLDDNIMEEALPSTDEDIMPAISTNPTVLSKSSHSEPTNKFSTYPFMNYAGHVTTDFPSSVPSEELSTAYPSDISSPKEWTKLDDNIMEEALPSTDEDIMPAISTNPTVLSKSSHSGNVTN